jgi:hypothetical protein
VRGNKPKDGFRVILVGFNVSEDMYRAIEFFHGYVHEGNTWRVEVAQTRSARKANKGTAADEGLKSSLFVKCTSAKHITDKDIPSIAKLRISDAANE